MNKNLYRIIFNKRRGQLMVVAENASSQGKAAKGEGGLDSGVFGGDGTGVSATIRPLALAVFGALGMVAFVSGPAMGQIVADPNAPGRQRPTVVQSANGVTQVNIQTPSAAGVSRNTYSQFDVTANGAILNNSRGNVQTQTGGWVQGNPWLAGGSARVILNEVNSANPSQLRGYVEVAGQRAEVVIANPAGVAIDGGGFINASRVTLTTGTPILSGGSLDGYMVQRGVVSINGRGLDTSLSDYTAILARATQINGGIWAQELKVVTGSNQIDAAHGVAGGIAGAGPAPAYALDVAQLGGMYAGKIILIGTEAGLGVRNAGVMAATAGNLVLQSNGWLSNNGNIQSAGAGSQTSIAVTGDVANSGTVYAGGDSQVQAQGNIANSGVIAAQNNVTLQATGRASHIDLAASAVIASGLNADNSLRQAGDLRIAAGEKISIRGTSVSGGNSQIEAGQLDLKDARLSGAQLNMSASAGDLDASRANITTQGTLSLRAGAVVRTDAAVVTANQIDLHAHDLSNIGGQISQFGISDLLLQLPGTLNNSSGRIASNSQNLTIRTQMLHNVDGNMEHAGTGAFTMTVADALLGQRGRVITNGGLSLDASKLDHRDAVMSAQQIGIKSEVLDNRGGSISQTGSGQASMLATQSLDNRAGSIELGGDAAIATSRLLNIQGRITSTKSIGIKAGAELSNRVGIVASGQNLTLEAGNIDNAEGTLQAFTGQAMLQFADLSNTAGSIYAGTNVGLQGGNAYSSGSVYAVGNLAVNLGGKLTNTGVIAAHGNNSIRADSLSSGAGSLIGAGIKTDGSLAVAGDLTVNVSNDLAAHGQNLAAGMARLNAASINLDASQTSASQIAMKASAGNVSSAGAIISTQGTLSITANANTNQVLDNSKGTLSAGQLDVALSGLNNRDGVIIQTGTGDTKIALKSPSSLLDNTRGRIAVNSHGLDIAASSVTNTQGRIEHAGSGNLSLQAAILNDEQGTLISNGSVHIVADAMQHDGAVTSANHLNVDVNVLSNHAGQLVQTGTGDAVLTVRQGLDNAAGEISSNGTLSLQAGSIDNTKGRITSAAAASISSKGQLENRDGVISTGSDLAFKIAGDFSNSGLMYAGRDQQWTVGGALVNSGSIAALGNTTLQANSIASSGLLGAGLQADGSLGASGNLTLTATQGIVASGQNLAAGQASLTGASLDLSGSQTGAANIDLTASAGNITTVGAVVSTPGLLAITANAGNAQALVNTGKGQLSAGQLALQVANLDNSGGDIVQTGQGKTVIATGLLDNTGGRIAVNSSDLDLSAATLTNINGRIEHAGNGVLAITANSLNGQGGKLIGNGTLRVDAGSVDHRAATLVAQQVSIQAGSLDNRGGGIGQTGTGSMTLGVAQTLDNTGGRIESNGDLAVTAGTVLNQQGLLSAVQQAAINALGKIDNTAGSVATGQNLSVTAQQLDNLGGKVQAQNGNASLQLQELHNTGSVFAGGNLDTQAAVIRNSGSLYAAGNQRLQASGLITNTGVIAAQGDNRITVERIDSGAQSLLGAGIKADGSLGTSGDLTLAATQSITASGQNLAAGHASLTGAALDLGHSQTSAGSIDLTATHGDISTAAAVVSTPGLLSITANSQEQQALQNAKGTLSAGQLAVQVGQLDNQGGKLLQTGTGTANVTVRGQLDNSQAGELASNGQLLVQAGSIDNSGKGRITSTASLELKSVNAVNNTDGVIAATQDISVKAGSIDNSGGTLQASSGSIGLDAGSVRNAQGVLSAGKDVRATLTGDLTNTGLLYAGRDQQWTVGGVLANSGSIAALGNTTLQANSIASSGLLGAGLQADGSLGASGNLTLTATQGITASGQNLAAGQASLTGASLDLSGSQTGAANIALTATQGNVLTRGAVVSTPGLLSITANAGNAQALVNTGKGQLSAGQLALQVANLDNSGGDIVQTGLGKTVIATGLLDNTGGRIAVNSSDLRLDATTLTNLNGRIEHAGNGLLAITANALNGQGGKLIGNGVLRVEAGRFDHRDATLVAQQVTIQAGSLDNRGGHVIQTGLGQTDIKVNQTLNNALGEIASNGMLAIRADMLGNAGGQISTNQGANIDITSGFINTDGVIAAVQDLSLSAASIDNQGGNLRAIGGNVTLQAADFGNKGGSVYAGHDLTSTVVNVNNSGSLYALGNQILNASGTVENAGVIASLGNTDIHAGSFRSQGAASLLGAGIKADGTLVNSATLNVVATQDLLARGQNLATGNAVFTGASVDVSGSKTSATNITLTATSGNVTTSSAAVSASGALTVNAGAQDSQSWINSMGEASAGQLLVHAANLDNSRGTIIQSGTGDGAISVSSATGVLNNTGGRIAVNANNFSLAAKTLLNVDGKMEHAASGIFAIGAGNFTGDRGWITSNGSVKIDAGTFNHGGASLVARQVSIEAQTLNNAKGSITQLGTAHSDMKVSGRLDNSEGVIASNGDIAIKAGDLDNRLGTLQAAGTAQLDLAITGTLDNRKLNSADKGLIAAGGKVSITAGELLNQQGKVTAGTSLEVGVRNGIENAGGLLAATGNVIVTGASLDNAGGTLASVGGNVQATLSGLMHNAGGKVQAGGDVILNNHGLTNSDGASITGRNVAIDSNGQELNNRLGTIAGTQSVNLQTGAILNAGGRMQAGTSLSVDTHGQVLNNANAGNITSGGTVNFAVGNVNNAGGYIGAAGAIIGHVGQIDNTANGAIVGQSTLNLTIGGLNNQGGQIQVLGDLGLNTAGMIANQQGLIRSGGTVTLTGAAIDNSNTQASNKGIEGINLALTASNVVNSQGALRADNNLTLLSSGVINNNQGLISAGNALSIRDLGPARSLSFSNSGGTAIAGKNLEVRAASLSGDGSLLSQQDLTLDLSGNYSHGNGGKITANGNASIVVGGNLSNAGMLQAGGLLDLRTGSLDNAMTGDIHATTTRVSTAGVLNNRGLIDGINTEVNAGALNNVGSGRIYGDHLSIAAGAIDNNVEAGRAAVIAARTRLDIGAQTINNNEHALIFSAGDMAIGGALDASRFAVGQAAQLTNASAEIEALGNMRLDVARVDNLNKHFTLQLGANTVEEIVEYQVKGRADRSEDAPRPYCLGGGCVLVNKNYVEYTQYIYTRTTTNSAILTSDPGKIVAGGSLTISAGKVFNENSHIIAGGLLSITPGALVNTATQSVSMVSERGTADQYRIPEEVGGGMDVEMGWTPEYIDSAVYERNIPGQSAPVTAGRVEGNTAVSATGKRPDAVAGIGGLSGTSGAGKANAGVNLAGVAQGGTGVATVQNVNGQGATAATGAGAVNSTDRAGSAGQAGDVAKAAGATVAAAQGAGVQGGVGLSRASDVSTAAQGRDANNTARLADSAKGGTVSTVGAATAGNANPLVTADGSVDAKALERAANGKVPDAITGAAGVNHSDRAGDAGRGGAVAAVAGISAGAANGGAAGMADPSALAGAVNSGAAGTVAAVNGPNASDRTGSAGQAGSIIVASGAKVGAANGAVADNSAGPLAGAVVGAAAGEAVNSASGANAPAGTRVQAVGQVALASPSGRAQVVRTTLPSMQLPTASLFKLSPAPGARFLVETDPRFTNHREWAGSDYLLAQVQLDPSVTQKRLGDGFYEQRLVREQIAQLTGQRFVGDYTGDEEQYKGLMDAGANYAKQWDLRPGVALTAEQMAALTSDIVWLVEQDVTLADGSTQKALVPQVYVRLREGDIDGSGALLAGKDIDINLRGDLTNSGTIAGRNIVRLTAENVQNMGGRIDGDAVGIAARSDLNNIGGTISANSELIVSAGRDINITSAVNTNTGRQGDAVLTGTSIGRVAGLYVSDEGGTLAASAGRDISLLASEINNGGKNGATVIKAGGNLILGTIATGDNANVVWGAAYSAGKAGTSHETGSTIAGAGSVIMNAGGDINARYSSVQAGTALAEIAGRDINNEGSTFTAVNQLQASAGRDINLLTTTVSDSHVRKDGRTTISDSGTVVDRVAGMYVTGSGEGNTLIAQAGRDISVTAGVIANAGVNGQTALIAGNNLNLNTVAVASAHGEVRNADNYSKQSKTSEVGSQVMGAGNVNLQAGNDLTARAADVQAGGALGLVAGNDISLINGFQNEVSDVASKSTKSGFWNKTTTTKHDVVDTTTAIGTSLGGSSVTVQAGHDLQVTGSSILSDDATKLLAGNNITIDAATNTVYELHHSSTKKSGFMSSGGIGFSYGTKTTTVDQERDATLQSGEARSSIGATGGALTMVAGNNVTIGGSDILAATDLDIIGKSVTIKPGQDNEKGKFEVKTTQDGLTLALGGSVISAIQTLQTMSSAASTAKDGRVTAMAAATTAMAASDAAKDMMKEGGPSISISLTAGHSESIQTQTTASTTHSGSVLTGNNINITAMGGGKDSNINILGSDLNAKNDIRLHADNNVNLLAAQDTESQHSKSSSISASVGVKAIVSTQGTSFGFTASVSGSKGHEDGDGTTQLNTHVNAGDKLVISSGGDTNIKGAVASANQVIADIKGNLNLESLQDLAKFDSKSQSISASGTVGIGASVSGSYSQSNMHNDYASVQEQSAIKAGNGGFQIKVGGNTDLKGAVISATEAGKLDSSLITATLTHSDIVNHAISKGSSVGVSGGFSVAGKETEENKNLTNVGAKGGTTAGLPAIVALSENASSTTRSGISGGTLGITDDAAQRAATGKGADESVAGVNRDVTTGVDSSGKIGNNFDKAALQATMDVTAAFAAAAAEKLGTYASDKLKEAKVLAAEAHNLRETDPERSAELTRQSVELTENWKEGGLARVALHTAIGGLAGGANGALGAGAAALSTDRIAKELKQLDMPETLRDALTLAAGAAVGAAVGGATGAASATNEVANNYLKHKEILELSAISKACSKDPKGSGCDKEREKQLQVSSAERDAKLESCKSDTSAKCQALRTELRLAVDEIDRLGGGYRDSIYLQEKKNAKAELFGKSISDSYRIEATSYREMSEVKLPFLIALINDPRPEYAATATQLERYAKATEGDKKAIAETVIVDVLAPILAGKAIASNSRDAKSGRTGGVLQVDSKPEQKPIGVLVRPHTPVGDEPYAGAKGTSDGGMAHPLASTSTGGSGKSISNVSTKYSTSENGKILNASIFGDVGGSSTQLGGMKYSFEESGNLRIVTVDMYEVNEAFRGKGLSTKMFSDIQNKHNANMFEGAAGFKNKAIYSETGDVNSTPWGRSMRSIGFETTLDPYMDMMTSLKKSTKR